ncbi:hypothetical protein ZOD2009_19253 [Haladaptatus paucihalophilus DX253]|uniref:Uncharacterized protein n=1 Tax=Haladaptatus paucihalophilus DX253 TaxID=797209 RepID=E7QYG0_HALPU|nr:DUF5779 family protein [Haladaptatus paucihalophilus]EFW90226.1 hypothetical protein ZOD2009_19253 [Haladaptatus paucihalophilus DX253]SHJ98604.1 hypothetical protein SAMN05444342_0174 [Haladaptatus paucihalophilus DX253]
MNDSGFDLDLQAAEQEIEFDENERVILGVLDGTTAIAERLDAVERGHVLVLAVDGDLTELAADLAPAVKKQGGNLVHFREFLIISPPGIEIDTSRL